MPKAKSKSHRGHKSSVKYETITETDDIKELSLARLSIMRDNFLKDPHNKLAQNVCWDIDPMESSTDRERVQDLVHEFNNKIALEGKPVCNQKKSGRCWLFACMNIARIPVMKHYNMDKFEFSQSYLFFWDKVERVNFILHNMVRLLEEGEEVTGRTITHLLRDSLGQDGGQWDMVVNLVEKHGLIPKTCYPESFSSEDSSRLGSILRTKIREYTYILVNATDAGETREQLDQRIAKMMVEVHKIVGICLGIPPTTFVWQYSDKDGKYHRMPPMSPHEFYHQHIKPIWNISDKICLVSDPRPSHPFGKTYTVDSLGNMVGGRQVRYINQPIDVLRELAKKSIESDTPVWFGCDVGKRLLRTHGVLDLEALDYSSIFGTNLRSALSRSDRLIYGDSLMTHAMVFTGYHAEEDGNISRWRVENSWGSDSGKDGYLLMSTDWFEEFVYEIVIDKKFASQDIVDIFESEPKVLPAWDPMGSLACDCHLLFQ